MSTGLNAGCSFTGGFNKIVEQLALRLSVRYVRKALTNVVCMETLISEVNHFNSGLVRLRLSSS